MLSQLSSLVSSVDYDDDVEAGSFDEEEEEGLFDWARDLASMSWDDHVESVEDDLQALSSILAPWRKRVNSSAQATMESTRRYRYFLALVLVALFFFSLAFLVGLPVLPIRPQKFSINFTLGSLTFMASFAVLRGWKPHLAMLFARDRALFTASYVATMLATLYAAVVRRSYIYTIICSGAQFTTLLYYLGTFIPGGYRAVRLFLAALTKTAHLVLKPILAACFRCCFALVR